MSDSTLPPEVQALSTLCDKATPGPWRIYRDDTDTGYINYLVARKGRGGHLASVHEANYDESETIQAKHDVEFIAETRTAVPQIIAALHMTLGALQVAVDALKSVGAYPHAPHCPVTYSESYCSCHRATVKEALTTIHKLANTLGDD